MHGCIVSLRASQLDSTDRRPQRVFRQRRADTSPSTCLDEVPALTRLRSTASHSGLARLGILASLEQVGDARSLTNWPVGMVRT